MTNLFIRANWTATSEYHIDFDRGSVTHSRAASRGQSNRIFANQPVGGDLKHLSYAQVCNFFKLNKTGENYMQLLRAYALSEVHKATRQTTCTYRQNHSRFFEWAANTLNYPVVQDTSVGYVRSPLDRQKMVDYMGKLVKDSVTYGQVQMMDEDKELRKKIVLDNLRQVAFAAPQKQASADEE